MPDRISPLGEIFEGLEALAEGAFPKRCPGCDRSFASLEGLIAETRPLAAGDLQAVLQDEGVRVQLRRRCACGTDLSALFDDRRASDPLGLKRRQLFDRLLSLLTDGGMDEAVAKVELLKVMRGEPSTVLGREQLQRLFS